MKKVKVLSMILTISMVICMFGSVALAVTAQSPSAGKFDSYAKPVAQSILGIVALIAGFVATGMLIYIGIKYMTKGAGGKAEVKDTILPYLVGAVLVGGAAKIAQIALQLGGGGGGGS